jgi:pimeloyl-ACP methyl ester carboxylesterase
MEREVRYCTTEDGVRIAYCVEGSGPPLLITPIYIESFSLEAMFPALPAEIRKFTEHFSVIRYDPRGVGLSDRAPEDLSPRANSFDIEAILVDAGVAEISLWAWGAGGTWVALYAARHPEKVNALVLWNTYLRPLSANSPETLKHSLNWLAPTGS